jgi:plasmid stabilization system protein ParE
VTRVIWAPQAIQDVEAIRAYVARDSARYADLVVERIVAAVGRLESNPRTGRIVPGSATNRSAKSSTATTASCIARDMKSSKLRPCFTVPACSDSTEIMTSQRRTFR